MAVFCWSVIFLLFGENGIRLSEADNVFDQDVYGHMSSFFSPGLFDVPAHALTKPTICALRPSSPAPTLARGAPTTKGVVGNNREGKGGVSDWTRALSFVSQRSTPLARCSAFDDAEP